MGVALVVTDRSPVGSDAAASLARHWAESLAVHLARPVAELLPTVTGLLERLLSVLRTSGVDVPAARRVGAALVELEMAGTEALEQTVRLLAAGLPARTPALLSELIGGVCAGFAEGIARRPTRPRGFAAFDGTRIGLWIADIEGTILKVNEAYTELLDRPAADIVGHPVCLLAEAPEVLEQVASGATDHLRLRDSWLGADGAPVHVVVTVTRVGDVAGAEARLIGLVEQVSSATADPSHPDRDPLTGIPHRAALFDALAAGPGSLIGLCYFDLDGFKAVNDTLGNDGGDEVLRAVAQQLDTELTRDGHMVARTGGDEFAVLVHGRPGTARQDLDHLQRVSQRVLEIVRRPVQVAEHRVAVTASAGVVRRDREREGAELMRAAGTTLSRAKKAGRNRIALFDADLHDHDVSRFAMTARMPRALADGEFCLQYQPLVRMDDGTLVGVEALARWNLPNGELIAPDRFVALAEETGMIVPLGRWCSPRPAGKRRHGCRGRSTRLNMSVNLAARQVRRSRHRRDRGAGPRAPPTWRRTPAAGANRERVMGAHPAAPRSRHWPRWGCGSPSTTSAPATPTWRTSARCRCTR